ncbi:MAG: hypothetical protein NTV15_01660 [Candidatus Bathyarchaeota archaeon]|nr:hypothetical protein [Candidatus Bathyarchaeota archaeon]
MSKKKGKPVKQRPMSKEEVLIREKGKRLIEAEKEYWQEQKRLREDLNAAAPAFMEGHDELLPADISSMVWLLRDGAAFVRYKTEGTKPGVQWRVLDVTLEEWARRGWIVPVGGKDISLTGFISGLGNATFYKCRFNDIFIEYASFSHVRYDEPRLNPSIAEALLEFRLAVLGMTLQQLGTISSPPQGIFMPREDIVKELKSRIDQFRRLLLEGAKEEELQVFLKENPFLLQPGAIVIPW